MSLLVLDAIGFPCKLCMTALARKRCEYQILVDLAIVPIEGRLSLVRLVALFTLVRPHVMVRHMLFQCVHVHLLLATYRASVFIAILVKQLMSIQSTFGWEDFQASCTNELLFCSIRLLFHFLCSFTGNFLSVLLRDLSTFASPCDHGLHFVDPVCMVFELHVSDDEFGSGKLAVTLTALETVLF